MARGIAIRPVLAGDYLIPSRPFSALITVGVTDLFEAARANVNSVRERVLRAAAKFV